MKDIFVSKIKRLAVAMFAALCVGNVWGAYAELKNSNARIEGGDFKFTTLITQIDSTSTRYGYLDAEVLNVNNEVVISSTRLINGQVFANSSNGYKASFDLVFEGVGTTTGCSTIEEFYDKGYCVKLTFNGTKKTTYTELDCPAWKDLLIVRDTGVKSCEMKFAESSSIVDGKLVPSSYPYVSGEYDTTKGITKIVIRYSINDESLANALTKEATLNSDGTYRCEIPAEYASDVITWEIIVYAGDESGVKYRDPGTGLMTQSDFMRDGYITFTWTGNGNDDKWDNFNNWSWDPYPTSTGGGYPGRFGYGYYVTIATFTKNADVDLNGGEYYLKDGNRGFVMSEGITVKLKNGTLGFQPHNDGNPVTLNLGKKNSTLHLKDVEMPYNNEEIYDKTKDRYKEYDVMLVADSTVIVEGNQEYIWRFYPGNARTKFKVANGIMQMKHRKKQPGADSEVEISNAVWVLSTCIQTAEGFPIESCQYGLAMKTIFRDGPDRQAQLMFRETHTSGSYYNLKLVGTYDFKLPASPYDTPYLIAGGLSTGDACTISVDVSDLEGRARVPLMEFKTVDSNVTTAMNTMVNNPDKLVVTANGKNVKTHQRARLEWDSQTKTLYYVQDPIKGFRVIVR